MINKVEVLWRTENSLLLQQGSVAESKPRAMAGPEVSCPTAALESECGTTGETWAQPGAKHGALSARGLSSFAPSAEPSLCQAPALPGPLQAELLLGQQEGPAAARGTSFILGLIRPGSWLPGLPTGTTPFHTFSHKISAYSNNTKLTTTTNKASSKSIELDNSHFNEISWLQLLPRQMSNLLSDREKQHSIASAPLGTAFSAFFTGTYLSQCTPQKGGKEHKVRPAAGQSAGGRELTSSGRLHFC